MLTRRWFAGCALCAAMSLVATGAEAQGQGFTRKLISKTPGPSGNLVTVQAEGIIDPGFLVPRHTHPGVESGFLIVGSGSLIVAGQPDRMMSAGESYVIPTEVPHAFQNGQTEARLFSTYVVDGTKPLTSPAPA